MLGPLSYSSLVSYSKITQNNTTYFCEYTYTKYKTMEWNYKYKTSSKEKKREQMVLGEREPKDLTVFIKFYC